MDIGDLKEKWQYGIPLSGWNGYSPTKFYTKKKVQSYPCDFRIGLPFPPFKVRVNHDFSICTHIPL